MKLSRALLCVLLCAQSWPAAAHNIRSVVATGGRSFVLGVPYKTASLSTGLKTFKPFLAPGVSLPIGKVSVTATAEPVVQGLSPLEFAAALSLLDVGAIAYEGPGESARGGGLPLAVWKHAEERGFARTTKTAVGGYADGKIRRLEPKAGDRGSRAKSELPAPKPKRNPMLVFLGSFIPAQFGLEMMGLAVPLLATSLTTNALDSSAIWMTAFAALGAGSLLGGPLVDRLGVAKVYLGSTVLRAASIAVLAGVFAGGGLSLTGLTVLFAAEYFFLGASRVAESILPTKLESSAQGVNRLATYAQMAVEAMGVIGLTAGIYLLQAFGYGTVLSAYPILLGASALIAGLFLRLPKAPPSQAGGESSWKKFVRDFCAVMSVLRRDRGLLKMILPFTAITVLTYLMYFTVAPAFGVFAATGAASETATYALEVAYAGGGLLGTLLLGWLNTRAEKAVGRLPEGEREAAGGAALSRSAARWLVAGAVALLGAWALPLAGVAGPWLAVAAFAPIGVTFVGVYVQLESLIKTRAPESIRGSVMGVLRMAMIGAAVVSFPLVGGLLSAVGAGAGLAVLAALMTLLAAAFLWVAKGLRK